MRSFSVRDFGAEGDPRAVRTVQVQAAIDACGNAGGGRVLFPPGVYTCGTLRMRSGVELRLEEGATLLGVFDRHAYAGPAPQDSAWLHGLIVGEGLENVAFTGEGVIDGNHVFDPGGEEHMRGPHTILLRNCRNVRIDGITIRHAGNYAFLYYACDDVAVENATFEAGWDGVHFREHDGRGNRGLRIRNCRFFTGDDAIAGSGVRDAVIEQTLINSSCNGIRLIGPADGFVLRDCRFTGPGRFPHRPQKRTNMLAGILLQPSAWDERPGPLRNVHIHDVEMDGVMTAFDVNLRGGSAGAGILIERVRARLGGGGQAASAIQSWSSEPFRGVTLRDIDLTVAGGADGSARDIPIQPPGLGVRPLPVWGFYGRQIEGLVLERMVLRAEAPDARPAVRLESVAGCRVSSLEAPTPPQLEAVTGAEVPGVSTAAAVAPPVLRGIPGNSRPWGLPDDAPLGPAWASGATLYQLNVHNYTPAGTLAAAAEHLPRLADLGIGIVWLMPIHPRGNAIPPKETLAEYRGAPVPLTGLVPFDGNPFCPRDHRAIDPLLGTKADLKAFTDRAHGLGMKVILGWVPNHSSWDAPLLADHPEYYMRGDRGQVLYHAPWEPIARLDYRGDRGLWEYMLGARRGFVEECGIDGFREDVAGAAPVEHWEWLRRELDPTHRLLFLAEADNAHLLGPLDMLYDWEMPTVHWRLIKGEESPDIIDRLLTDQEGGTPQGSRRLRYQFNHDQTGAHRSHWQGRQVIERLYGAMDGPTVPTHREKLGDALPAMALLNVTLPRGRPLVFMGTEIGFYGGIPHNRVEGFRIPWDAPPDASLTGFHRQLAALFREQAALQHGDFERIDTGAESRVYAFSRSLPPGDCVVVAVNLSNSDASVPLGHRLAGDFREYFTGGVPAAEVHLPPWGHAVFVRARDTER